MLNDKTSMLKTAIGHPIIGTIIINKADMHKELLNKKYASTYRNNDKSIAYRVKHKTIYLKTISNKTNATFKQLTISNMYNKPSLHNRYPDIQRSAPKR